MKIGYVNELVFFISYFIREVHCDSFVLLIFAYCDLEVSAISHTSASLILPKLITYIVFIAILGLQNL